MTYSTFLCLTDRVRSLSRAPTFPLQPSHTPPLCCSAGRNATSSPPARLAPSPEGTETRFETTTSRGNTHLPIARQAHLRQKRSSYRVSLRKISARLAGLTMIILRKVAPCRDGRASFTRQSASARVESPL